MRKLLHSAVLLSLLVFGVTSCILDPKNEPDPPGGGGGGGGQFEDLSERDHVLINLEEAYNTKNYNEYARLVDDDFSFFFSKTDIDSGFVKQTSWGKASELNATKNMFSRFAPPGRQPIDDINLTLTYTPGEDVWTRDPGEPGNHEGEDWYERTVSYNMSIRAGEDTFISNNITASFVVRNASTEGDTIWRIIAWRDDI